MPDYRRYRVPGGTYFFTVNLLERSPNDLLVRHVDLLRSVVRDVRAKRPFIIDAWVVLPDHLHCVCTFPPGDDDFATASADKKLLPWGEFMNPHIDDRHCVVLSSPQPNTPYTTLKQLARPPVHSL